MVTMSAGAALLAEVPFLALLDDEERETLSGILEARQIAKGETIFTQGDVGDCLFIVRRGSVLITMENTDGARIILDENKPGDALRMEDCGL